MNGRKEVLVTVDELLSTATYILRVIAVFSGLFIIVAPWVLAEHYRQKWLSALASSAEYEAKWYAARAAYTKLLADTLHISNTRPTSERDKDVNRP